MEKESSNSNPPRNEVDNIRSILFGDQINQMEERFKQIENSISQLRTENRNLREALESELTQREKAIQEIKNILDETEKRKNSNQSDQVEMFVSIKKTLDQYQSSIG